MEINRSNFHPNFQAKLITANDKVQEYVKKSFISKDTFDILDKFHEIYPDSVVTVNIKKLNSKNYLVAKNGITGAAEAKLLHGTENINPKDNLAFIELIKKIMKKKSFWNNQ